jgi:hypothetical protein
MRVEEALRRGSLLRSKVSFFLNFSALVVHVYELALDEFVIQRVISLGDDVSRFLKVFMVGSKAILEELFVFL